MRLNKFKGIEIISSNCSDYNSTNIKINYRKKNGKRTNTWRLNNMLIKIQWVKDEIKGEIRKYLKTKENKNTTLQNLWDAAEAVLRGKFIVIQASIKKQEKSQINKVAYHLKELEKVQTKPIVSRMKEIIKIGKEMSKIK